MRGVTVTESLAHPDPRVGWTVDDLNDLPDDGFRHEILDGRLVLTPPPDNRHVGVTEELADLLQRQIPPELRAVAAGAGVRIRGGTTYFIPDLVVLRRAVLKQAGNGLEPCDVVLVVEVLSPSNARTDLILKRHDYAAERIPAYWIVDPEKKKITVLEHDGDQHYIVSAEVAPGRQFSTDHPFPVSFDPAEIFS